MNAIITVKKTVKTLIPFWPRLKLCFFVFIFSWKSRRVDVGMAGANCNNYRCRKRPTARRIGRINVGRYIYDECCIFPSHAPHFGSPSVHNHFFSRRYSTVAGRRGKGGAETTSGRKIPETAKAESQHKQLLRLFNIPWIRRR